jgi:hypothetical protein
MRSTSRTITCALIAAMLASSPAAAATAQSAAPAIQTQNSWATLAMLTPVSAATLGQSAAAAAAQPEGPPPPPPPPPNVDAGIPPPPIPVLIVLAAWLATIIYIATRNHGRNAPNSPA